MNYDLLVFVIHSLPIVIHYFYLSFRTKRSVVKNLGNTAQPFQWMLPRFFGQSPQQLVFLSNGRLNDKFHLLAERRVLSTANATRLAEVLEGNADASVRGSLGEMPSKEIRIAVEDLCFAWSDAEIIL